ncbi:MAG: hypothetical protein Q7S92_04520 [Candidatus Diapherotrites archaeon]|nr:hypothetical protein [Candidatus Diapherotrites archaeon]
MHSQDLKIYYPSFFVRDVFTVFSFIAIVFYIALAFIPSAKTSTVVPFLAVLPLLVLFSFVFFYLFVTRKSIQQIAPIITVYLDKLVFANPQGISTELKRINIVLIAKMNNHTYCLLLKNPNEFIQASVENGTYMRPHFIIRAIEYSFLATSLNCSFKVAVSSDKKDNIVYLENLFKMKEKKHGFHLLINASNYKNSAELISDLDEFTNKDSAFYSFDSA